jgi:putative endonuclease
MSFYTYILKSLSHGTYYYGHTNDLERRIEEHNKGQVKYTKGRRPWILHYSENYETKSLAARREVFFKSIDGYNYLRKEKVI